MPRKPRFIHAVRFVRTCLGLTQAAFAKSVGCSTAAILRVENGSLALSQELAQRIMEATGADPAALRDGPVGKALLPGGAPFTKEGFEAFQSIIRCVGPMPLVHFQYLAPKLAWLLLASERAGQDKANAVGVALAHVIEKVAEDFNLRKNIDGLLIDNGYFRKMRFRVGNLRVHPDYARGVGFEDDPRLKPDSVVTLKVPVGWFPSAEFTDLGIELPPAIEQKYAGANYVLDLDRPIPKEMEQDLEKGIWLIKESLKSYSEQGLQSFPAAGFPMRPEA